MSIGIWAAGLLVAMAASASAMGNPLEEYRWKNRIVLIFGSDAKAVGDQVQAFKVQAAEADDRDLIFVTVDKDGATIAHDGSAGKLDASNLRDAFSVDVSTPFTLILIGKDGGEKLRKTKPVPPGDIFGLIDTMPMRAQEMSNR